ncbi:hypothetical protein LINPERPRIM_LOCUS32081 [Linum perenne]
MGIEISDELLGTFVPILVYWVYSGIYCLLGLWFDDHRLHSKQDEDDKNLVSKLTVVNGVLCQQVVQALVATLLFAVRKTLKDASFFLFSVFPAFCYELGEIVCYLAPCLLQLEELSSLLTGAATVHCLS